MNKGYKGLYLKELKRADELEDTVVKLERKVKRYSIDVSFLLVSVLALTALVVFKV